MSKRTSIYLAYFVTEQDNDSILDLENQINTGNPLEGGFTSKNDPERSVFALGMKHKF
jgi:predicted porin